MSQETTKAVGSGVQLMGIKFGLGKIASETFIASEPDFQEIKPLMSKTPLRFRVRFTPEQIEALQDKSDIEDAIDALKEPGGISLKDLKKNLGM